MPTYASQDVQAATEQLALNPAVDSCGAVFTRRVVVDLAGYTADQRRHSHPLVIVRAICVHRFPKLS